MDTFNQMQEWLTVSAYLGLTVLIIWRVFITQKK